MIYFVTGQRELFEFPDAKYKCISVEYCNKRKKYYV